MPIFWSFQKFTHQVSELELTDLNPILGDQEKEIFQKLKFPKRKLDWLGGRLITKNLVKMTDTRWKDKELYEIEILNEESGAPYLNIQSGQEHPGRVSLSHSNGYGLSAYSPNDIKFGFDLELIEPRSEAFVQDFFTSKEFEQVAEMDVAVQSLFATVIWSGKESVLKALSTGLRVDTRSVEITIPEKPSKQNEWKSLGLKSRLIKNDSLHLLWRREGNFVITACIPSGYKDNLEQIDFYNNFSSGR